MPVRKHADLVSEPKSHYVVQPIAVYSGRDESALTRQYHWQAALRRFMLATLAKYDYTAFLQYTAAPSSVLRDIALHEYFSGMGWTKGRSFMSTSEWRSVVTSASGPATSRSSADPPHGVMPGQRMPVSLIGDSGTLLNSNKGVRSLYPTFQDTPGLEDTQVMSVGGATLGDLCILLEQELAARGGGPERWLCKKVLAEWGGSDIADAAKLAAPEMTSEVLQ